jgi:hypothetical protein
MGATHACVRSLASPTVTQPLLSLNLDRYYLRRIKPWRPSSSPLSLRLPIHQTRYSCLGDLSLLSLFAVFFCISIACTARTVPARAEPPEPRPAAEILLRIGGQKGFWGASSRDCSLPYDYFHYDNDKRMNDYFLYVNYERTTTSPTAGLHCDPLPASTMYDYPDWGHSQWVITEIRVTLSPKLPQGTLSNKCSCLLVV